MDGFYILIGDRMSKVISLGVICLVLFSACETKKKEEQVIKTSIQVPSNTHLKELDWLAGKWFDKENNSIIEMESSWDQHKNFLTQKFNVTEQGKLDLKGFQIIGWDPIRQQIRSWVFDSDGGFGEGVWTKQGDKWLVEVEHTLPNGLKGSAQHIYSNIQKDSYTWESTGREVGGNILPNLEPATVHRK